MIYNTPFQGSKSHLFRNQGAGTFGCLFFLVLIAIFGYVSLKFGEAGWDYVQGGSVLYYAQDSITIGI